MNQRANVLEAASSLLDERARLLGQQLGTGTLTRDEAAAKVLSAAVDSGVVDQMCARHHRHLAHTWDTDGITAAVTSMLAHYALGGPGGEGNLDPSRFTDSTVSASGWVGKVIGSMRTTRILREMRADTRELASPLELERIEVASAEDVALDGVVPEVDEPTRGLPAPSATIRVVHASALHQLLGLPPLRSWRLTRAQKQALLTVLKEASDTPGRVLAGHIEGIDDSTVESIRQLWSGWSQDDVAEVLAKSTPERNISRLLGEAALRRLPRPTARSGEMDRLRGRARDGVPATAKGAVSAVFTAFVDCRVEAYTDLDRIRRRPAASEVARRDASSKAFPVLLQEAERLIDIDRLDLLSGLICLFIDPLPVANSTYFVPTSWRFPS